MRWCRREEHGEPGEQACDCGSTGMTGATRRSPGVVVVVAILDSVNDSTRGTYYYMIWHAAHGTGLLKFGSAGLLLYHY